MKKRGVLVTLALVLAFVALLLYGTVSGQKAECSVVVEFAGGRDSATASAASAEEAERQAMTTACGTLARGMNESIACGNRPPIRRQCRTL
jgi:hypothetical protein